MGELEGTLGALLKGITARVFGELVKTYGWKTAVLYVALAFAALFAAALAIRAIYKIARFALISAQRIFRKLNPQVAKASLGRYGGRDTRAAPTPLQLLHSAEDYCLYLCGPSVRSRERTQTEQLAVYCWSNSRALQPIRPGSFR